MKHIIFFAVGVSAMSAGALAADNRVPPTHEQIQAVESRIGKSLQWPEKAKPIVDYDRHYFWDEKQPSLLRAQFSLAKEPGKGKTFSAVDYKHFAFDGGCSIVNLAFYGEGDPRNMLKCGGR